MYAHESSHLAVRGHIGEHADREALDSNSIQAGLLQTNLGASGTSSEGPRGAVCVCVCVCVCVLTDGFRGRGLGESARPHLLHFEHHLTCVLPNEKNRREAESELLPARAPVCRNDCLQSCSTQNDLCEDTQVAVTEKVTGSRKGASSDLRCGKKQEWMEGGASRAGGLNPVQGTGEV